MEKPRVVVLTKSDLSPPPEPGSGSEPGPARAGRPSPPGALVISSHTGEGIRELLEALWRLLATDMARESAPGEAGHPAGHPTQAGPGSGAGRSPGA